VTARAKAEWRPLRPVPGDAPPPPAAHYARGKPLALHTYRDEEGAVVGYVADFLRSDGTAKQVPLAYCEDILDGEVGAPHRREWRWRWFDPLRPLFALDRLADVDKPVLLLADEAESNVAATYLGQEFACVSWANGARGIDDADFAPLKHRQVVIWLPIGSERYTAGGEDPVKGEIKPLVHHKVFAQLAKLTEILKRLEAKVDVVLWRPGAEPDGFGPRAAFERGMSALEVSAWIRARSQPISGAESLRGLVPFIDGTALAAVQSTLGPAEVPAGISTPPPAAAPGVEGDWLKGLLRDPQTGRVLPEVHNLALVLRHHREWRDVIYQDDFAHRIMKRTAPPVDGGQAGEWSDADDVMARSWMASQMGILRVKKADVPDAVLAVASVNRVNPLQDYLRGLKWDGTPRLRDWLITYCGAGEHISADDSAADIERKEASVLTRYLRLVGPLWLMGAVRRGLHPGCKFDYVLILEGEQGLGKSSVLNILGGQWGMDSPISFTHKDSFEALSGIWIVEIPELDAFSKADSTTSKSFFTRAKDRYRLPYAKRTADFPRTCVFAGTTNEGEFYRDSTGNRRYWAVTVRNVDREALARDRDQLFAEAVAWIERGEPAWPIAEQERELVEPEQRRRMVFDPWIMMLGEWLTGRTGPVTMSAILIDGLKLDPGKVDDNRMAMRVGRAMRKLGYRKVEDKTHPERFYYEKMGETE